ncbi:hypothetical protein GCM10019060_32600 [Novosphingobium pokkalii]|nr:hypothetical protein GCM10019060_32600 [Novosphingobium pokkalii]
MFGSPGAMAPKTPLDAPFLVQCTRMRQPSRRIAHHSDAPEWHRCRAPDWHHAGAPLCGVSPHVAEKIRLTGIFCDSSGNRLWPAALEGAHEGGFNREIAAMATVTVAFRQQFTRVSACMNITEPVDNRHDVA